ncbi:MAG: hypothetical protein HYW27_03760 [Candidatus Aenigmarchaeota archaeon]|nr:hypothetical protein [Candidatus Aenigmarchaeota archaeon]
MAHHEVKNHRIRRNSMKPGAFVVVTMLLYAIMNVVVERKLAGNYPAANMVFFYAAVFLLSAGWLLASVKFGVNVKMPETGQWKVIGMCGAMLFFADLCFFSAYYFGASVATVSTISILFPVFASAIKFASGGGMPTTSQITGMAFAAIAVYLTTR